MDNGCKVTGGLDLDKMPELHLGTLVRRLGSTFSDSVEDQWLL